MARMKDYYKQEVAPALMKKFGYKSVMQIPKLEKIVINVSSGEARDNSKIIDAIVADLSAITGQRPVVCKATIWALRNSLFSLKSITIKLTRFAAWIFVL